jgi:hypothetical protein
MGHEMIETHRKPASSFPERIAHVHEPFHFIWQVLNLEGIVLAARRIILSAKISPPDF